MFPKAVMSLASVFFTTSPLLAGVVYQTLAGASVGGNLVNATAELENVNGNLQIRLENLATDGTGNISRTATIAGESPTSLRVGGGADAAQHRSIRPTTISPTIPVPERDRR